MQLITRRLRLREFAAGDWQLVHTYRCDPRYLQSYHRPHVTSDETRELIEQFIGWQTEIPRLRFQFVMEIRETEQLIGNCGLRQEHSDSVEANVGFELDSNYWNRGYASEAVLALLEFGFRELGLEHIRGWCLIDNTGSGRVLEKCGLRLERRQLQQTVIDGQHYDTLIYGITSRDWKKIRRKYGNRSREHE